jgi:hypothetical protein
VTGYRYFLLRVKEYFIFKCDYLDFPLAALSESFFCIIRRGGLGTEYYVGRVTRPLVFYGHLEILGHLPIQYVGPISIAKHIVGARAHHEGGLGWSPGVALLYPIILLPTLFLTKGVYFIILGKGRGG